jgi:hypothetical protein
VTWGELFFDLVLVFAVTEVSQLLRVPSVVQGGQAPTAESGINWLTRNRGVATRFDKLTVRYAATLPPRSTSGYAIETGASHRPPCAAAG